MLKSEDGGMGNTCSHLSRCFRLILGVCSGTTGLFALWLPPGLGFGPVHPTPLCPSAEVNTEITFFFPRLCAESVSVERYVITYSFLLFSCIFYVKTSSAAAQVGLREEPQQKGTLHRNMF